MPGIHRTGDKIFCGRIQVLKKKRLFGSSFKVIQNLLGANLTKCLSDFPLMAISVSVYQKEGIQLFCIIGKPLVVRMIHVQTELSKRHSLRSKLKSFSYSYRFRRTESTVVELDTSEKRFKRTNRHKLKQTNRHTDK